MSYKSGSHSIPSCRRYVDSRRLALRALNAQRLFFTKADTRQIPAGALNATEPDVPAQALVAPRTAAKGRRCSMDVIAVLGATIAGGDSYFGLAE